MKLTASLPLKIGAWETILSFLKDDPFSGAMSILNIFHQPWKCPKEENFDTTPPTFWCEIEVSVTARDITKNYPGKRPQTVWK